MVGKCPSCPLTLATARWFFHWLLSCVSLVTLVTSHAFAADSVSKIADGELKACQIVTVNQAWAVGDRGLILATSDAGKTWSVQSPRFDATLHSVCFEDEKTGWALGGAIEPGSHRSTGVVLKTIDGGRNWQSLPCNISRITGAQLIEKDHLLSWGDWSNLFQSALFESIDGGVSWAARPTPCSHIQSAASGLDGTIVLVDRVGKVHRSRDGIEFQSVDLPVSPFDPIRFCKIVNGVWWLGGEAGQLYRSSDAVLWQKIAVPGNANDHSLIAFKDIAGVGNRVCIVGQPGNVVWASEDGGDSWSVRRTGDCVASNGISVLNADVLLICGPYASIRTSRNGGKAWWQQHHAGTRLAMLNVASTSSSIGWDLLAQVTLESRRQASILVLHDQCFEERASHRPEIASRIEVAAKSIQLAQATLLASMPVGNLISGNRPSDMGYYGREPQSDPKQDVAPIIRLLVNQIRASRPDVLLTNCEETGTPLERRTALAVDSAAKLAAAKEFRVYSDASGIPEDPWQPKRILVRGTRSGPTFSPSMLLKSSNVFLGSALANTLPLTAYSGSLESSDQRYSYRVLGAKGSSARDPLEGLLHDPTTFMNDRSKIATRLPSLMSASQLLDWKQVLDSETGNPLTPDRIWESKLRNLTKEVAPATLSPILLDIAIQSRRAGEWYRWQTALELLLEKDSTTPSCENAFWELMVHTGSQEVHRVVDDQLRLFEKRTNQDRSSNAATIQQASPFAVSQQESSPVQTVSYTSPLRKVPLATSKDLSEFARMLSKWPDSLQSRRSEPRWGWLIASRYRLMQQRPESLAGLDLSRNPSVFWPFRSPQIASWKQVHDAENWLLQKASESTEKSPLTTLGKSPIRSMTTIGERPFLDGKADEVFWATAAEIQLRDPWNSSRATTSIRITRDEEFLYLFSRSPKDASSTGAAVAPVASSQPVGNSKDTRHDRLSHDSDHIRLRLDLDRDYASWLEVGWSVTGETWDAYNDMPLWNPNWWIATSQTQSEWNAEIAIPLQELMGEGFSSSIDSANTVWAFNATRSIPSVATLTIAPSLSDRMTPEDWVHFGLDADK
jgi:photosystem II stability/assembly factor-like uncharacterized protein